MGVTRRFPKPDVLASVGAYLLLGAVLVFVFAAARSAGDWSVNWQSGGMRLLMLAAAGALVVAVPALIAAYRTSTGDRRAGFWFPVTMSVFATLLGVGFAELAVRVLAKPDLLGARVGGTVLQPYDWDVTARSNLALFEKSLGPDAYFVMDPDLGWTVAPGRASADGLYKSSAEGLRSREVGETYAGIADTLVALFGNSFAFSEEVPFDDSLAHHLELDLGAGTRILNFGVPGYGVDQALLRFRKDGRSWAPRVAVLTFIQDDLFRVANVYTFFKVAWGIPLSKPRFVLRDGELLLLNSPTISPPEMFSRASVFDLPLLDLEIEFFPHRWSRHPLHASQLLRFLTGAFPVWPSHANPATSEDAIVALSTEVITTFVKEARDAGIAPLVVYLPTSGDLSEGGRHEAKRRVLEALATRGIEVVDITACFGGAVTEGERFLAGGHYSGAANAAVSKCLAPFIRERLQ